jgi:hypothetical protein
MRHQSVKKTWKVEPFHVLIGHDAKTKTQISQFWVKPLILQNQVPNQLWLVQSSKGQYFEIIFSEE